MNRRAFTFTAAGTALLAAVQGCNIVAPAYFIIAGPGKVKKLHELERDRATVIFVDDRASRVPRRALRSVIARSAEAELLERKALTDVIASNAAQQVASQDRFGDPMPITSIAKAVEAEVIIYATVDSFGLTTDGQSLTPSAQLRVKVIDAVAGERLWPPDRAGQAVTVRIPPQPGFAPTSRAEAAKLEEDLARNVGLGIAQLFYDHERPASTIQ